jgi:hypothetical protein
MAESEQSRPQAQVEIARPAPFDPGATVLTSVIIEGGNSFPLPEFTQGLLRTLEVAILQYFEKSDARSQSRMAAQHVDRFPERELLAFVANVTPCMAEHKKCQSPGPRGLLW